MIDVAFSNLTNALNNSWSAHTSSNADWSKNNPAEGQCAVAACVIQDYLGGDIVNVRAIQSDGVTVSHYFNMINGEVVDLTKSQFNDDTVLSEPLPKLGGYNTTRDYCLSYPDTLRRYRILSKKVAKQLAH